jgi:hypothetical protein
MELLKINNKYYHILQKFQVHFFETVVMEYVILQDDEILYFTNHSWWGNKRFWTIDQVSYKLKEIETRNYRNPDLKESRLKHWNRAFQVMMEHKRDKTIDTIIKEEFIWQFG